MNEHSIGPCRIEWVKGLDDVAQIVKNTHFDAVLLDVDCHGGPLAKHIETINGLLGQTPILIYGEEEDEGVAVRDEDEGGGGDGGYGGADLAPGAGVAVDLRAFVAAALDAEPGEDHGFVGAGAGGIADGEEAEREEEWGELVREAEGEEAEDVGDEGEHHRFAPAVEVGDGAGGDFDDVDG